MTDLFRKCSFALFNMSREVSNTTPSGYMGDITENPISTSIVQFSAAGSPHIHVKVTTWPGNLIVRIPTLMEPFMHRQPWCTYEDHRKYL